MHIFRLAVGIDYKPPGRIQLSLKSIKVHCRSNIYRNHCGRGLPDACKPFAEINSLNIYLSLKKFYTRAAGKSKAFYLIKTGFNMDFSIVGMQFEKAAAPYGRKMGESTKGMLENAKDQQRSLLSGASHR